MRRLLADQVHAWIKAPTEEDTIKAREAPLKELQTTEQAYLAKHYRPKEKKFLRCWTGTCRNLGAKSSQRNEDCHVIVKAPFTNHLQLHKAVEYLVGDLENPLSIYFG